MKILKHIIAGLACIALFAGCITVPDSGKAFNTENIAKIKVGESTETDVVTLIGEPASRNISSNGMKTLNYQHVAYDGSMSMFNPFDTGQNMKIRQSALTVVIGPDGKVASYSGTGE